MRRVWSGIVGFLILFGTIGCSPRNTDSEHTGAESDSSYFFVFLDTNPERAELPEAEVNELQALHIENITRLYKEGKLDVAGPFEGGGGLFLLKAPDRFEAMKYVDSDPAVQANRFRVELFEFDTSWGSVCKVADDAEMAKYGFLRFREVVTGVPADNVDQREALSESGDLLFSGWFDGGNAGVMVMRTNADSLLQNIVAAHPGVSNGHLKAEIRQVWVGKGVFCEE